MTEHGYPPINAHAFLSDAHTAALIGPDLTVSWMCAPRFDAPSIFAGLLDRHRGGAFSLQVADVLQTTPAYVDRSLVLRSDVTTGSGRLEVLDGLTLGAADAVAGDPFRPDSLLVRHLRAVEGTVRVAVDLDLRPDYARGTADWQEMGEGHWRTESPGTPAIELYSGAPLRRVGTRLVGEAELSAGETVSFALRYDGGQIAEMSEERAGTLLRTTCEVWQRWSRSTPYEGVAAAAVEHSASVLRGLAFDLTGAVIAAPTTSLPEHLGGSRNWDYRYSWHRDSSLMLLALFRLGHAVEGERFLRFLLGLDSTRAGRLLPMAGIGGEGYVEEVVLDHLEGYAGSAPVRIGNGAFGQVQLDTYGHILDAVYVYQQLTGGIDPGEWAQLRGLVDTVADQWREPDHGLWEMRGPKRHYVNSKVMCWVALDRGIRLAELLEHAEPEPEWLAARDELRAEVLDRGYDAERGTFTMAYDYPHLDASVLHIPLIGFLSGDDPRVVSTIDRLIEGLGVGEALLQRYDAAAVDDGVGGGGAGGDEAPFLLSSFQLVSALALAGREEEARRRFDWLLAHAGPLGLYSEEMTAEGMALGNYPQGFTHLALIEAALNLDEVDNEDTLHAWARRAGRGVR